MTSFCNTITKVDDIVSNVKLQKSYIIYFSVNLHLKKAMPNVRNIDIWTIKTVSLTKRCPMQTHHSRKKAYILSDSTVITILQFFWLLWVFIPYHAILNLKWWHFTDRLYSIASIEQPWYHTEYVTNKWQFWFQSWPLLSEASVNVL